MNSFLDRIERAWKTSSTYRRRVSILLLSHDRNYTLEQICQYCKDGVLQQAPIYHISALGRKKLKDKGDKFADIPANVSGERFSESESVIQRLCEDTKEGGIYIIDDFLKHLDDRDATGSSHPVGTNRQLFFDLFEKTLDAECNAQVIIFLEHSEKRELIPDIVDAEIQIVEHPYPSHDEVKEIAAKELKNYKIRTSIFIENESDFVNNLSQHLSGFAYSTISWMIRDALIRHEPPDKKRLDPSSVQKIIDEVRNQKEGLIGQQLGMSVLKSTTDRPIGVERFISYIEKRNKRICIPGQDRLKGVLLIGPPGTGKSMLAKYLSSYLNKPAVEVRLSSLMSKWMGETEQLFQRLTNVLDAMAPVIVYMDEIEKMFSEEGSGSSAGASMVRATGRLLSWMNDTTSPIFIIATANNIARMGEIGLTMTRRGRFDALFYIGYPDIEGRKELFKFYARDFSLIDSQYNNLAQMTSFFTGADIDGVVQEAISECEGVASPDYYQSLEEAVNMHRPRAEAMRAMYNANAGGVMKTLAMPAGSFEPEDQ